MSIFALGRPWSYLIAFVLPALDGIVPLVPSESAVVALGVATAGSADPRIGVLVLLSAAGAFVGDNVCYLIGRHFGPWARRHFFTGESGERRRVWTERALARYGIVMIVVCRFLPGGRTAVTLTCGATGYSRRRFVPAAAVAGLLWALYAFFVGRIGGHVFTDRPWLGLMVALGIVLALTVLIETVRRATRWWHGPATGSPRQRARLAGCDLHLDSTTPAPGGDTGAVSCGEKGGRRVDHVG